MNAKVRTSIEYAWPGPANSGPRMRRAAIKNTNTPIANRLAPRMIPFIQIMIFSLLKSWKEGDSWHPGFLFALGLHRGCVRVHCTAHPALAGTVTNGLSNVNRITFIEYCSQAKLHVAEESNIVSGEDAAATRTRHCARRFTNSRSIRTRNSVRVVPPLREGFRSCENREVRSVRLHSVLHDGDIV